MPIDYTERWFQRFLDTRDALIAVVEYYAPIESAKRSSGDVLPLARAFKILGWEDPMLVQKPELCDEPGCGARWVYVDHGRDRPTKYCAVHWELSGPKA